MNKEFDFEKDVTEMEIGVEESFNSSFDKDYSFKMSINEDYDLTIKIYHKEHEIAVSEPIHTEQGLDFHKILSGREQNITVHHNSLYEGKFDTTIQKSILQEQMETAIVVDWKNEFTVDISDKISYKIDVDDEGNKITASRIEGRLSVDNEDSIVGRKGHEPTSQSMTSSSIKEIVDFMCDDFYKARQGVRTYDEEGQKDSKGKIREIEM